MLSPHTESGGGWPMPSPHTKTGALPFSRSLREGGALADIAAADHPIHANLLLTTRCPARFNLDRAFFGGSICGPVLCVEVHRSFVGRPSLCEGLRFLRMTAGVASKAPPSRTEREKGRAPSGQTSCWDDLKTALIIIALTFFRQGEMIFTSPAKLAPKKAGVPCPSRVLCERAGLLAMLPNRIFLTNLSSRWVASSRGKSWRKFIIESRRLARMRVVVASLT